MASPLTPPPPVEGESPLPQQSAADPAAASIIATATSLPSGEEESVIDPALMALPAPLPPSGQGTNGKDYSAEGMMGITESIASAPNPRTTDFLPPQFQTEDGLDLEAIGNAADDDMPGSPTAKLMRAIAPPNAAQSTPQWPPPPPNASVNLFIGRALLSNGNDNWPLKPNDIVNWIRKHYPAEWDGDEGRCSAHRVRTYLARKGADMYYEKLNQGCIAGWRIRQNHLWRFENGGFQGRGMKQEEAIANAQKESELLATAARKAAAAEALAAGHPGVKVTMSQAGTSDGHPPAKRPRTRAAPNRRKSTKRTEEGDLSIISGLGDATSAYYDPAQPQTLYSHLDPNQAQIQAHAGPSNTVDQTQAQPAPSTNLLNDPNLDHNHVDTIDPSLDPNQQQHVNMDDNNVNVDINIVQQAMQAAAGQIDDLEMGMQLPIEMQMHSNEHDDHDHDLDDPDRFSALHGHAAQHPYTPHDQSYSYTG